MRTEPKKIVWFSCGAPSAVCGKLAIEDYGKENVEICYCNTFKREHPDNRRFIKDVEKWLGVEIKILSAKKYLDANGEPDIYEVFDQTGWLVGVNGARCTTELKKKVREDYQLPEDVHIFGLTLDETMPYCKNPIKDRVNKMKNHHHDLLLDFILVRHKMRRDDCLQVIKDAGIEIPAMYKMGYNNNNCIGCVKGGAGYWNKIRVDFPEAFEKMAKQERLMGVSVLKKTLFEKCGCNGIYSGYCEKCEHTGIIKIPANLFLDELDPKAGNHKTEHSFECGVMCQVKFDL